MAAMFQADCFVSLISSWQNLIPRMPVNESQKPLLSSKRTHDTANIRKSSRTKEALPLRGCRPSASDILYKIALQETDSVMVLPLCARGVPLVAWSLGSLFAALLVQGGPLLDARIVTLELDPRIWWEVEYVLHDFTAATRVSSCSTHGRFRLTYRILSTRPPLVRVQMLSISSPLRMLSTAPQTSSPASPN